MKNIKWHMLIMLPIFAVSVSQCIDKATMVSFEQREALQRKIVNNLEDVRTIRIVSEFLRSLVASRRLQAKYDDIEATERQLIDQKDRERTQLRKDMQAEWTRYPYPFEKHNDL